MTVIVNDWQVFYRIVKTGGGGSVQQEVTVEKFFHFD